MRLVLIPIPLYFSVSASKQRLTHVGGRGVDALYLQDDGIGLRSSLGGNVSSLLEHPSLVGTDYIGPTIGLIGLMHSKGRVGIFPVDFL